MDEFRRKGIFFFFDCIELYEVISMGKPESARHCGFILPLCISFLCIFLFLGAVYRFDLRCREWVEPIFPLFGKVSSRLDEAAEELKEGKTAKEATEVLFLGVFGNVETDSY